MGSRKRPQYEALRERHLREWAEYRHKLERAIANFQHAYMSNAKWRKAFSVLSSPELSLKIGYWKFVADDRVFEWPFPREEDMLEARLVDGSFQPIAYREIELIEIPARFEVEDPSHPNRPPKVINQDVVAVLEALDAVGRFPTELTEHSLVIRGYS